MNISLTKRERNLIWDALYATRGRRGNYTAKEADRVMRKMKVL